MSLEDFFSFFSSNRCCNKENDLIINQTLTAAKEECMIESRKVMRKSTAGDAGEENFEGDGGLYNMFSCERTKRWKTMVTCTIDCVSQKVGMVRNWFVLITSVKIICLRLSFKPSLV
jgi:hypothetical protein